MKTNTYTFIMKNGVTHWCDKRPAIPVEDSSMEIIKDTMVECDIVANVKTILLPGEMKVIEQLKMVDGSWWDVDDVSKKSVRDHEPISRQVARFIPYDENTYFKEDNDITIRQIVNAYLTRKP